MGTIDEINADARVHPRVRWLQQPEQDSPSKLKRKWQMQNNDPKVETTEFQGRRILVTGGNNSDGLGLESVHFPSQNCLAVKNRKRGQAQS